MKTYTITFLILVFGTTFSWAQGWERQYEIPGRQLSASLDYMADGQLLLSGITDEIGTDPEFFNFIKTDLSGDTLWTVQDSSHGKYLNHVIMTQDGGMLISGLSFTQSTPSYIQKLDSLAKEEWTLDFSYGEYASNPICELANGDYFVFGRKNSNPNVAKPLEEFHELLLHTVDVNGQLISTQQLDTIRTMTVGRFDVRSAFSVSDGGAILFGFKSHFDSVLIDEVSLGLMIKVNAQGEEEWRKELERDYGYHLVETSNGDYIVSGDDSSSGNNISYVKRLNSFGTLIWRNDLSELQGVTSICPTLDGNYYLAGNTFNNNTGFNVRLSKMTPQGELLWNQDYLKEGDFFAGKVLLSDADGGAYLTGSLDSPLAGVESDFYLIKTDNNGLSLSNQLLGTVYHDEIENCDFDSGETGLENVVLQLKNEQAAFYARSDSSGAYFMPTQDGDFTLKAFSPSPYLESCVAEYPVSFPTNTWDTITIDVPIETTIECPYLEVSMGTWALRPCFPSSYSVRYQNLGTIAAENAYVEITLDSLLTVDSASIAYTELDGVYTFDLGTVDVYEMGSFSVWVFLDCDAEIGLTHCSEAHIFPDSLCLPTPGWSGASVEVDVACTDGEVSFNIQNVGTSGTTQPIQYFVVEDNVILMQDTINTLESGALRTLDPIDAQGASFYLRASQEPNHPGMNIPSIAIEGCANDNDPVTLGNINLFAQNDANPFIDIDCIVNTSSYDPNDKQGLPLGVGDQHFIEQNQALEYRLRFQNVGTDTAFNVVILDTLTNLLDIPTIRPGASSHPYEFELYGDGIIKFTFPNILLPDSTTNELGSQGFVKFKIQQERDLPLGSVIENSAGIYFDFNDPVITNTTMHTIGEVFPPFQVGVVGPVPVDNSLTIVPNPFNDRTVFKFENYTFKNALQLNVYDALGRQVKRETINGNNYELYRGNLSPGIYFFRIQDRGIPIVTGKLVID